MRPMTAREVERVLSAHGFRLDRARGSHRVWVSDERFVSVSVPTHGNKTLQQGLLNAIFNEAGIPKPAR